MYFHAQRYVLDIVRIAANHSLTFPTTATCLVVERTVGSKLLTIYSVFHMYDQEVLLPLFYLSIYHITKCVQRVSLQILYLEFICHEN